MGVDHGFTCAVLAMNRDEAIEAWIRELMRALQTLRDIGDFHYDMARDAPQYEERDDEQQG